MAYTNEEAFKFPICSTITKPDTAFLVSVTGEVSCILCDLDVRCITLATAQSSCSSSQRKVAYDRRKIITFKSEDDQTASLKFRKIGNGKTFFAGSLSKQGSLCGFLRWD